MITAYGLTASGNCWKVATILRLTGRAFRWVEVDSNAGGTRTPEFLAMNPNGKVPVAVLEDGAVVTESGALLCHFAEGTAWLPPPGLHKRFDTLFYLAALPAGEVMLADGHEAVKAHWARPAELLADAGAGRSSLLFPTRCNIARLGQFDSVAALLADDTPPPFIQPDISADGWLTIPEGVGYPYTRERLETVRRS
jgi:hypothetical protein